MNEAQISLADKISGALKRLIASKLGSQYKGETPYSGCLVQEGYFNFLCVECRGSRIRLYLDDFGADSFRADAPEADELEREEFEAIVPLIAKSAEEEFLAEANLPFFAYKLDLAVKFEGASGSLAQRSCEHKFYFENAAQKAELRRKMDDYIDEIIIRRDKKAARFSCLWTAFSIFRLWITTKRRLRRCLSGLSSRCRTSKTGGFWGIL